MPHNPTASRWAATLLGTTALLLATACDDPGATDAVDAASPSEATAAEPIDAEPHGGTGCEEVDPMGLWRLTDGVWVQVSPAPFPAVRPLEALDGLGSLSDIEGL